MKRHPAQVKTVNPAPKITTEGSGGRLRIIAVKLAETRDK